MIIYSYIFYYSYLFNKSTRENICIKHKELDVTDPLQRVIDWQLSGVWPEDISKKKTKFDLTDIKMVIRSKKRTSALNIKEELEARLIDAIERKMNREDRDNRIYRLYTEDGYKQTEIAEKTGLSQQHVSRILKKVCANRKKMSKNNLEMSIYK